jgi:hypothetical protein
MGEQESTVQLETILIDPKYCYPECHGPRLLLLTYPDITDFYISEVACRRMFLTGTVDSAP